MGERREGSGSVGLAKGEDRIAAAEGEGVGEGDPGAAVAERAADDVADSTSLTVIQKLSTLDHLETSLCKGFDGAANGLEVGKIFRAQGIPLTDATDLLTAFRC